MTAQPAPDVVVVGAGVIGLSTGVCLAERGQRVEVRTFSVWSDVNAMRSVVVDRGHRTATQTNTVKPFHHASAFIRYRILDQTGTWP